MPADLETRSWTTIGVPADPTGLLDLPGPRLNRSAGGSLWHLRHAGLLPGDTVLDVYGHLEDPTPGSLCVWHANPDCYTPSRRKKPVPFTVDDVLAAVTVRGGRYTLCSCFHTHPRYQLTAAGTDALAWLRDTDPLPDSPQRARTTARSLTHPPDLLDVPAPLATRVRARAVLRRTQLLAAPTTRDFQSDAIHDLCSALGRTTVAATAAVLRDRARFLTGAQADDLAGQLHDAAAAWNRAYCDDIDDWTSQPPPGEDDDPYATSRRGALHDATWARLTSPAVWLRAAMSNFRGEDNGREFGCLLDASDDLSLVLVPVAFLAVGGRGHLRNPQARPAFDVLGPDDGYDAELVSSAVKFLDERGADDEFTTILDALTAAALPAGC